MAFTETKVTEIKALINNEIETLHKCIYYLRA